MDGSRIICYFLTFEMLHHAAFLEYLYCIRSIFKLFTVMNI